MLDSHQTDVFGSERGSFAMSISSVFDVVDATSQPISINPGRLLSIKDMFLILCCCDDLYISGQKVTTSLTLTKLESSEDIRPVKR